MTDRAKPSHRVLTWISQLVAAAILAQTLFFKLTGAPESVWIFTELGAEPWGRYGSAVVEALAVLLLLLPGTAPLGALLALGTMAGAIASHVLVLGIEVQEDGGLLFALALVVATCSLVVLWQRRRQLLGRR